MKVCRLLMGWKFGPELSFIVGFPVAGPILFKQHVHLTWWLLRGVFGESAFFTPRAIFGRNYIFWGEFFGWNFMNSQFCRNRIILHNFKLVFYLFFTIHLKVRFNWTIEHLKINQLSHLVNGSSIYKDIQKIYEITRIRGSN